MKKRIAGTLQIIKTRLSTIYDSDECPAKSAAMRAKTHVINKRKIQN